MVPKLYRGRKRELPKREEQDLMLGFEAKTGMRKRKRLSKRELSVGQLREITTLALKDGVSQLEITQCFGLKPSLIKYLV